MSTSMRTARTVRIARIGGALLALAPLTGCWGNTSEKPPVHIIHNMDFQQKFDAQEASEFYADGRSARPQVDGTVARGKLKNDRHLWEGRGSDGRFSDELPRQLELDADFVARGRERYDIYCAPCHDHSGQGEGPVTRRGGGFAVAPANLHQQRLLPMPLGYLYDIVANGKMPNMYPYAAQIPVEDRWAIAVWVRALQTHGRDKGWGDAPMAAAAEPAVPNDGKNVGAQEGEQ